MMEEIVMRAKKDKNVEERITDSEEKSVPFSPTEQISEMVNENQKSVSMMANEQVTKEEKNKDEVEQKQPPKEESFLHSLESVSNPSTKRRKRRNIN